VNDSRVKQVTCEAHFTSSPEATWKLLNAFPEYPTFLPRVLQAESLGTSDDRERVYVLLDIPWPLPNIWNILTVTRDLPSRQLNWTLFDGNIKKNSGMVRVDPEGSGSLLVMEVTVDVGMGLPKWVVAWGAKHFLPKVVAAVGNRLASSK
jgi:uncharacterized membrane protein